MHFVLAYLKGKLKVAKEKTKNLIGNPATTGKILEKQNKRQESIPAFTMRPKARV